MSTPMLPDATTQPWYFQNPETQKEKVIYHLRMWGVIIGYFVIGALLIALIMGLEPRGGFSD